MWQEYRLLGVVVGENVVFEGGFRRKTLCSGHKVSGNPLRTEVTMNHIERA